MTSKAKAAKEVKQKQIRTVFIDLSERALDAIEGVWVDDAPSLLYQAIRDRNWTFDSRTATEQDIGKSVKLVQGDETSYYFVEICEPQDRDCVGEITHVFEEPRTEPRKKNPIRTTMKEVFVKFEDLFYPEQEDADPGAFEVDNFAILYNTAGLTQKDVGKGFRLRNGENGSYPVVCNEDEHDIGVIIAVGSFDHLFKETYHDKN